MARRYLSLSTAEWDRLAWWEQQMYVEGYEWEGLVEMSGDDPGPAGSRLVAQEVHRSGGTTITDQKFETTFSLAPGEVGAFGLTERSL